MFSKKYFVSLAALALFFTSSLFCFAQTAPLRGKVELKKADGTVVPVSGAQIDAYRIDSKGKPQPAKTDKKGNFAFAGLPLGQTFAFAVSAPGIKSDIFPNIKAGAADMTLTVYEGDGKVLTEDQVRTALASPAATAAAPVAADSEAAKKAKADYDKQVSEITARNEKTQKSSSIVNAMIKEGNAAYDAKNYDLAITKFEEGYNAEPEFAGSAPTLLNNKAIALRMRAFNNYKLSATDAANKAALMEKAKTDWLQSVKDSNRALVILKGATAPDAEQQKNYAMYKYNTLNNLIEVYRLLVLTRADQSVAKEASAAYTDYFAVETDAAKTAKAQMQLGDIMREAGESEGAIAAYRKVLEMEPANVDALAGLGLSLFNVGVSNGNKTQMQEGLNYMQKFADTAPVTHPLKASVKDAVDYLKNQEKLAPQKVSTPKGTKKGS